MNPLEYSTQKAGPQGSTSYYALQQAKPAQRAGLTALFAFRQELVDTVAKSSDPGVAQTKLAWWQKAVSDAVNLNDTPPSHPVLKDMKAAIPALPRYLPSLLAIVARYDADVMQARYLDFPGLKQHIVGSGGEFAVLVAQCSRLASQSSATALSNDEARAAIDDATVRAWAVDLGSALSLASMIADVGADARHGRIYLPISEMQQFGVTAADILQRRYSESFSALMTFQVERARDALHAALASIPPHERRHQRVLRAQAAMALRLLDEIENDDFQVLHQQIALTPIRKLWAAWWAARRY